MTRDQLREDARAGAVVAWLFAIAVIVIAALLITAAASRGAPAPSGHPAAQALRGTPHNVGVPNSEGLPRAVGLKDNVGGVPSRYRGTATWYCLSGSSACTSGYGPGDLVAAIDSDLGFARGDRIVVRYLDRSVTVTVVDVCGCPGERLVDLTSGAFRRLADLGLGVIPVTVEAEGAGPTLPPTDH